MKRIIEFILNWYWVGTIEKICWSIFITEGVWLMNWSFGKTVINKQALEAITFQALDYLGWVAIININLFIITAFLKWIIGHFRDIPDEIRF